ncbi:hypothetical protein DPMN_122848 [Dreissena polymorpha]|uniref:Uncharacterized protein n=1 Tax=Dreissena polymorpha TaxID=45954 RepID=A0A9D4JQQ8_DREPO|nr:hypothetical protein DPMN_122848 [Dreissena polymorpha]
MHFWYNEDQTSVCTSQNWLSVIKSGPDQLAKGFTVSLASEQIGQEQIGQEQIGQEQIGQEQIGQEQIGQEQIGQELR